MQGLAEVNLRIDGDAVFHRSILVQFILSRQMREA